MSEHCCAVCPQLRPGEPRTYTRAYVCDGCRSRLRATLSEFHGLMMSLSAAKGSGGTQRVSGSRMPPLPLRVGALDLAMPAHLGTVRDSCGDQVGDTSVATVLESWARDWQSYDWAYLPPPTVANLAAWLRDRLDTACDRHPAIDDFAWEITAAARKLRPAPPRPELKVNVPCPQCEHVTLYRMPGSDRIECGACPALLTDDEYVRWTQLITAREHLPWVRDVLTREAAHSQSGP